MCLVDEAPRDGELADVEVTIGECGEEPLAEVKRAVAARGARVSNDGVHNLVVNLVGDANKTTAVLADLVGAAILVRVQGDDVIGVGAPPTAVALANASGVPGSGTRGTTGLDFRSRGSRYRGDGSHNKKDSTREEHDEVDGTRC